MYHIKFFKVPSITKKGSAYDIKTVLTLTNDLGDHFFYGDALIIVKIVGTRHSQTLSWAAGVQSVKVAFDGIKLNTLKFELTAEIDKSSVVDHLNDPEDKRAEEFLTLYSIPVPVPKTQNETIQSDKYGIRKIGEFEMIEETGHAIAKKVWDGGIITSLHLQQHPEYIPKPTTILELGTGCGLLGLVLAKLYNTRVVVTDLEDAKEICETNISKDRRIRFDTLDWEDAEGKLDNNEWDLIIATDCTYNSDSFEPLLVALNTLATAKTTVVIGHKYRNASEEGFFDKFQDRFKVLNDQRVDMFGESVRVVKAMKR